MVKTEKDRSKSAIRDQETNGRERTLLSDSRTFGLIHRQYTKDSGSSFDNRAASPTYAENIRVIGDFVNNRDLIEEKRHKIDNGK